MRRHDTHDSHDFGSVSLLERRHAAAFYDALVGNDHGRRVES
jgi:hypothetical protein